MKKSSKKVSLLIFVLATLIAVGVVPLIITGWFLSARSGKELRAVEGRYQTQLVQDKARQIEMFAQRYIDLVNGLSNGFELSSDPSVISSTTVEEKLRIILKNNPNLIGLYVKPIKGEPLAIYRSESITAEELQAVSDSNIARISDNKSAVGKPQILSKSKENVLSFAAPVLNKEEFTAAIVAVVSLHELAGILREATRSDQKFLWESGLPIVYVIDEQGQPIIKQDLNTEQNQPPLTNLKIVSEWQESSRQIQSALVPFEADFQGEKYQMIGAYSTATISPDTVFGVISMQNEKRALASVGDMQRQTWIISFAMALIAGFIGLLVARRINKPITNLVSAAKDISSGNLKVRVGENNFQEINTLGETFNTMSQNLSETIAKLAHAAEENRELFVGTVKALAAAIDGKDHYTRGHSERVSRMSVAIGQRLGLLEEEIERLRISALLHDVGKIAVNDAILNKTSPLTNDEFDVMKSHAEKGYKIMRQIPAMKDYLPGIYMHHEMINGGGYPQGLKGEEIPIQAKIISVADTFDAITTDRPYQKGQKMDEALMVIKNLVGTRYDGKVVEALVQACEEGQISVGRVRLNKNFDTGEISSTVLAAAKVI